MSIAIPRLADLNATPVVRQRNQYTLETRFAVGRNGSRLYGQAGSKLHVLVIEVIVAEEGEHKPGTYKVGQAFSTHGLCGGNGQHTGIVIKGLDTDRVTCMKCLAQFESKVTQP